MKKVKVFEYCNALGKEIEMDATVYTSAEFIRHMEKSGEIRRYTQHPHMPLYSAEFVIKAEQQYPNQKWCIVNHPEFKHFFGSWED